ncbi:MAG: hypothetical protein JWM27_4698 [Gemmatimonadetes bacterium]|nr:hypothetical protein [Gemmatimonadota bacterium]
MKKLKMDLDGLQVQSFETDSKGEERGTVRGFDSTTGGPFGCQDACMSSFYCGTASGCDTGELACQQTEVSCPHDTCA